MKKGSPLLVSRLRVSERVGSRARIAPRRIRPRLALPVLIGLMFCLPAVLPAQNVYVSVAGITGVITGVPPVYSGRYVLQMTEYGFFWLDSQALVGGHIQAVSKCSGGLPVSDSGYYVLADCNSITNVSASGSLALVRMSSGQCGAQSLGCGGPRSDGHFRFTFGLGTWDYKGDLGEIPDSTDTADPLGRTWTLLPTDSTGMHFVWQSSGIPNAPPFADAIGTNLSANARADKANYYGDRWQLRDISSGATSVFWDFNYTGSFVADESGSKGVEGTVTGYFPCDPAGAVHGDIRSGANCRQSLGLASPPAAGSYRFGLRSSNSFGMSTNTYSSAPLPFACPQASIAGYTGSTGTCAKTGGTLTLSTGSSADASGSKGNLSEASFAWIFSFPSGSPAFESGPAVAVPNGAVAFSLAITYPAGYQATASGSVVLTPSLVAAFSTQNPVVRGSPFVVANEMEKAATTTLNSVDYVILPGACGAPPAVPPNPLPGSFLPQNGLASVTAPGSAGGYCISLKYNYTEGGAPASQTVSRPLTVTEWTAAPFIGVYLDAARTQPAPFLGGTYFLTAGTNYFLFDDETPPPPGTPYPGAQWSLGSPSGSTALGSTATQMLGPVLLTQGCSAGCSLKLAVGAATRQVPVNIAGATCTPNATTLCLNGGRFRVGVAWATKEGASGAGQAVSVTGDTGYFWFFTSGNVEIIVKVVDGRAVNSRFWVFAGGLTNVDVVMTVLDVQTGLAKSYHNPLDTAFLPIQDTTFFLASSTAEPASRSADPEFSGDGGENEAAPPSPDLRPSTLDLRPTSEAAACVTNAATLCLNDGRFKVQAQWTTKEGATGAAQAVALTGDTGYFWFFTSNNVEMVVKVVNGCGFNSSYWTFAGGLTDVNVVMAVTDTLTGATKTYINPQTTAFLPIQDTAAFPSCP
jgi:hypothetical protein